MLSDLSRLGDPGVGAQRTIATLATLAACSACAGKPPAAARDVVADVADVAAPPPVPAPSSRFSVPLRYDFGGVVAVAERAVPTTFGSLDSVNAMPGDDRRHFAYQATRGPFTAFANGDTLHLRSTVEYTVHAYYKPIIGPTLSTGCGKGDEKPRLVVDLATPISVSSDWRLVSHVAVARVEPASDSARDHCDVSILHRDITPRVVAAARAGLAHHLAEIDRRIAAVDLRAHAEEWWRLLGRPIKLGDDVWLVLGPERLRIGHVRGHGQILTVPVSLDAHPQIVTGAEPDVESAASLPPLSRKAIANGFHIVMDGLVDYVAASRVVTDAVTGKTLPVAGRTITVQSVTVIPASRGRLMLAVSFTGDARGTLRLVGTPRYDPESREIALPDIDFDLATNSQILQAYAWLRSEELRGLLRQTARWSADPAIERGRDLLHDGLNRRIGNVMTLSAKIDSVAVQGVYVTRDGLVVRGEATGRAGVSVGER